MNTILNATFYPGRAGRSRLVIPVHELQGSAESVFKAAAQLAASGIDSGASSYFEQFLSIARAKGFQHCGVLLSLVRRQEQPADVQELIREAVALMGGPGDFFDALDLIVAQQNGGAQ